MKKVRRYAVPSWGKYSYLSMSIGVVCALSMFQLITIETLRGLDVLIKIDDILVIQQKIESTSDHLVKVEQVLRQLKLIDFKANLRKSFFMQKNVEYLGY